ncbi:MAG: hypothetical protein ACP5M9_00010 [Candidatus Micrarchaeia archaeon]
MSIFDIFKNKKNVLKDKKLEDPKEESKKAGTITAVNIRFGGDVHSLPGMDVDETFTFQLPFQNTIGNGLLPDNLKGPTINVEKITVEKPFTLLDINPKLPTEVPYLTKMKFDLKIKAPEGNYSGPMLIKLETNSKDNIDLNISKIILTTNNKKVELEESMFSMNIKKGQPFKKDIQLYKVLSYNTKVSVVKINEPFEIISIKPGVPFILDKKDSYVANIVIKAPNFNYAGEMEIGFYE